MTARQRGRAATLALYFEESRDIRRSLALVVPLLAAYELIMLLVQPGVRNGAEVAVQQLLGRLAPDTLVLLRRLVLVAAVVATLTWARSEPARAARPHLILLEALLLACVLGPVVGWLVGRIGLSMDVAVTVPAGPRWLPFLLSVGAGLWEELVFRLGLLGGLTFLLGRALRVDRRAAMGVAILASALAFALYHHLGDFGEPLELRSFAFRAFAGTILGLLFAFRGLAVVVYMHVFYDVLCDLKQAVG